MIPASVDGDNAERTPAGVYGRHGLAVRCALEGRDAGAGGQSYRVCPYRVGRPFSQRVWLLGYVAGRRFAGLPMPGEGGE